MSPRHIRHPCHTNLRVTFFRATMSHVAHPKTTALFYSCAADTITDVLKRSGFQKLFLFTTVVILSTDSARADSAKITSTKLRGDAGFPATPAGVSQKFIETKPEPSPGLPGEGIRARNRNEYQSTTVEKSKPPTPRCGRSQSSRTSP